MLQRSRTYVSQQRLRAGTQTREVLTGLTDGLAIASALAAHRDHRGASWPVPHHPLWCLHAQERPIDVAAVTALTLAGVQRSPSAVGEAILSEGLLKKAKASLLDFGQRPGGVGSLPARLCREP